MCSFHEFEKWLIVHTFYNGLLYSTRMTLDAPYDGALMNNPQNIAYNLIEQMKKNHHPWGGICEIIPKAPKKGGLYKVSHFDHMNAKLYVLY